METIKVQPIHRFVSALIGVLLVVGLAWFKPEGLLPLIGCGVLAMILFRESYTPFFTLKG